ncbi:DUF2239 family protein [Paenibacillus filicis]|uniref:DUF2239 family protein n=1 Tax=Paenibacillus gyeongsangnamensis TaxID=3388067 RepID=A0ABT4Q1U5_9BACL|nr:DUF2239 family protein [Paenibacillus filicis]MCZ8510860.1 DUF2239 family protein [Paenibacillus filicis]
MNCMNCGSTHDVIDFIAGEEKFVLCADCRYKLVNRRGRVVSILNAREPGRPSLGVTRKVSLTLPEAVWEHLDSQANGNRSLYLRKLIDRNMSSEGSWSNNACLGYTILGAKRLGYSEEQTKELVRAIYGFFDCKTVEEARTVYEQSPY